MPIMVCCIFSESVSPLREATNPIPPVTIATQTPPQTRRFPALRQLLRNSHTSKKSAVIPNPIRIALITLLCSSAAASKTEARICTISRSIESFLEIIEADTGSRNAQYMPR